MKQVELEEFLKRIELESCLYLPKEYQNKYPLKVKQEGSGCEMQFADEVEHLLPMPGMDVHLLYQQYKETGKLGENLKNAVEEYITTYETSLEKDNRYKNRFAMVSEKFPADKVFYILLPVKGYETKLSEQFPCNIKNDTAFIYSIYLGETGGKLESCTIWKELFQKWNISLKELHLAAVKNMPTLFPYKIEKRLSQQEITAYLFSNRQNSYGLGTIFYEEGPLKEIAEEENKNLFVVALSTHEGIAVPDNGTITYEELEFLIGSIPLFTENIYYYYKEWGELAMNRRERMELEAKQKNGVLDAAEKERKVKHKIWGKL